MRLSDQQFLFAKDITRLFEYLIDDQDVTKFSIGECWRRSDIQKILKEKGYSLVERGAHQDKLAMDIFIWYHNTFMTNTWENRDTLIYIGNYWKGLNKLNIWGGDWVINEKPDIAHYERKRIKEVK